MAEPGADLYDGVPEEEEELRQFVTTPVHEDMWMVCHLKRSKGERGPSNRKHRVSLCEALRS